MEPTNLKPRRKTEAGKQTCRNHNHPYITLSSTLNLLRHVYFTRMFSNQVDKTEGGCCTCSFGASTILQGWSLTSELATIVGIASRAKDAHNTPNNSPYRIRSLSATRPSG